MKRIEETFAALATKKRKALVAYVCVGDPSVDESIDIALACVGAGADVLELGNPWSDPSADGPSIARASQRAIASGGGLDGTLRAAREIRKKTQVPIVLFGYYNPLFVRGDERVVDDAAEAGIDALLIVDLPLEEGEALRTRAAERGIAVVPLIAPTSTSSRGNTLKAMGKRAGFIYYVSVTGVTGSASAPLAEASLEAGKLREITGLPVVVGFGVDTAAKARAAAEHVDGVVVGTAIVRQVEDGTSRADRIHRVETLVRDLRSGLDGQT